MSLKFNVHTGRIFDERALADLVRKQTPSVAAKIIDSHLPVLVPLTPEQKADGRVRRNDLCLCGSDKKFKKCHMGKERTAPAAEGVEDAKNRREDIVHTVISENLPSADSATSATTSFVNHLEKQA